MADNVSKGQHSMSANNRSQGVMTVVATADFSAPRCAQHFLLFFACMCAIFSIFFRSSLSVEKLFCGVKNTSVAHAGGSVNRNKTKGVNIIRSQDGITAWAQPLKSEIFVFHLDALPCKNYIRAMIEP